MDQALPFADPRNRTDHRVERQDGCVVTTFRYGQPVRFFVEDETDTIQSKHHRGKFYEEDELLALLAPLTPGMSFLDIGANVGNHTLFFGLFVPGSMHAVIEPNPPACRLLSINLALNGLMSRVDLTGLGKAASDRAAEGEMHAISGNLGGAYFNETPRGTIKTIRPDALFPDRHFDFVKIDVEDMELSVLAGLEGIVETSSPRIFLEVLEPQEAGFRAWLQAKAYRIEQTFQHADMVNYLIAPTPGR